MQLIPTRQLWQYDWLIDLCVNHFPYFYRELEPMPRELVGASGLGERRPAFSVS